MAWEQEGKAQAQRGLQGSEPQDLVGTAAASGASAPHWHLAPACHALFRPLPHWALRPPRALGSPL